MNAIILDLCLIVVTVVVTLVVSAMFMFGGGELKRMERDLNFYKQTFLFKSGSTCLWPGSKGEMISYRLESFDGGKHWYATTNDDSGTVILGDVEKVYPGLLAHCESMDRIYKHCTEHGSLNLHDSKDVSFLESVGFTVTTNK